jgi:glycosyltransferase involved in cell wall biosynthesis
VAQANTGRQLRVLYVAVQDTGYPRNSRLREFLSTDLGADVHVLELDRSPGYLRHCRHLLSAGLRQRGPFDVVVLAELSVPFAWVSWVLARRFRAAHVVDFFVGLVETHVGDRGAHAPGSLRARVLGMFDQVALTSATLALSDTEVRADAIRPRLRGSSRAVSLPVGAPAWAEADGTDTRAVLPAPLRVLYYGNYVPLHGVTTIVDALGLVGDASRYAVTMLGDGEQRERAEQRTAELGLLGIVSFVDAVAELELRPLIGSHEVVLGIFGQSAKASSVIANKVWQGLAAGKVVVTRESPALAEISAIMGDHLIQVPGGDPQALATALDAITQSPELRTTNRAAHVRLERYVRERYEIFGNELRAALSLK